MNDSKCCPVDFRNKIDDKLDENESDQTEIPMVNYLNVDWTYPNIVVVFGQASRGISKSIARHAVQWNGCISFIPSSVDIPLQLSTAVSAILFEAARQN